MFAMMAEGWDLSAKWKHASRDDKESCECYISRQSNGSPTKEVPNKDTN